MRTISSSPMPDNNKLELVVEVDVNKANASIKSANTGLSSMEQTAFKAARGASAGIDGMPASMVKGAAAGNLIAESIKKALEWAKEWTIEAANHATHTDKMGMSMVALAKAHGVAEEGVGEGRQGDIKPVEHQGISEKTHRPQLRSSVPEFCAPKWFSATRPPLRAEC